ncbi:short-chain dehydrogenase [Kitasatospora sp. NPDC058218]|uniref:short-chain dehydrogenase n=1 Tax=Kitasatospora sp. NPDC058218 TaxID=3346385 RepID=UPI0036DF463E
MRGSSFLIGGGSAGVAAPGPRDIARLSAGTATCRWDVSGTQDLGNRARRTVSVRARPSQTTPSFQGARHATRTPGPAVGRPPAASRRGKELPHHRRQRGHLFATNHLGHFALTHHLAPLLTATPGSRIVTTGSFAAKSERLDLDDLQSTHDYRPKRAYARSKLAQMLFALELDRRLRAAAGTTLSVLVHPGGALDSLTPSRPPFHVRTTGERLSRLPLGLVVQGKDAAAWPAVRAVLAPGVRGGQMLSPRAFGLRGTPRTEPLWNHLTDTTTAARLWTASCELTGNDPTFTH